MSPRQSPPAQTDDIERTCASSITTGFRCPTGSVWRSVCGFRRTQNSARYRRSSTRSRIARATARRSGTRPGGPTSPLTSGQTQPARSRHAAGPARAPPPPTPVVPDSGEERRSRLTCDGRCRARGASLPALGCGDLAPVQQGSGRSVRSTSVTLTVALGSRARAGPSTAASRSCAWSSTRPRGQRARNHESVCRTARLRVCGGRGREVSGLR